MNSETLLARAARMQAAGEPYALVTVVRALAPTSAKVGDKALVTAENRMFGWVGGGCAQPPVIRTVRAALKDGRPRYIRVTPERDGERDLGDVLEFGMTCHSGGTVELFVEPVLPAPQLLVFGVSPVAMALAQLAPRVGFDVLVADRDAEPDAFVDTRQVLREVGESRLAEAVRPGSYVVVATQGRMDLPALKGALAVSARYVAFVASARKAQVMKETLRAAGCDPAAVDAIVAPAGYPIAATTPEEIALSVLAAVVAARRSVGATNAGSPGVATSPREVASPGADAGAAGARGVDTAAEAAEACPAPAATGH